ncbi:unnamed protein product [Oikopleura dioica]|uniref:Uncharacterized protein n=1 Tax=Oikopleura dioica TaxID=34765 RepID=E4Y5E1_OIKDI|nr:unnamed protein product [Oikopleura dioica]
MIPRYNPQLNNASAPTLIWKKNDFVTSISTKLTTIQEKIFPPLCSDLRLFFALVVSKLARFLTEQALFQHFQQLDSLFRRSRIFLRKSGNLQIGLEFVITTRNKKIWKKN